MIRIRLSDFSVDQGQIYFGCLVERIPRSGNHKSEILGQALRWRSPQELLQSAPIKTSISFARDHGHIEIQVVLPEARSLSQALQELDWEASARGMEEVKAHVVFFPNKFPQEHSGEMNHPPRITVAIADAPWAKPDHYGDNWLDLGEIENQLQAEEIRGLCTIPATCDLGAQLSMEPALHTDILILVAHGSRDFGGQPGLWLNDGDTLRLCRADEFVDDLSRANKNTPPLLMLACCESASSGPTPLTGSSTAETLVAGIQGVCVVGGFTRVIDAENCIEQTVRLAKLFEHRTITHSVSELLVNELDSKETPLRLFCKDSEPTFRARKLSINPIDEEAIEELRRQLSQSHQPVAVLGCGMLRTLDVSISKVAQENSYPLAGWPARDRAEVAVKSSFPPNDTPFICATDEDGEHYFHDFAALPFKVVFNLNRGRELFDAYTRAGKEPRVCLFSPRIPPNGSDYKDCFANDDEGKRVMLIQPFGIHPIDVEDDDFENSLLLEEEDFLSVFAEKNRHLGRYANYFATQIDLFEWLCPPPHDSRGANARMPRELRDALSYGGMCFLGVSPEHLECKVFLTWLRAYYAGRQGASVGRIWFQRQLRSIDKTLADDSESSAHFLEELVRMHLNIGDDQWRAMHSDLGAVLDTMQR